MAWAKKLDVGQSVMAARQHEIDWQSVYVGRVRAIEALYAEIHTDLQQWGRWGAERYPGRPRLMLSGIWKLPGDTDPNRDPEAAPSVKPDPIDELSVWVLDTRINDSDFPTIWVKVLKANYIPPKHCIHLLPEYQRPDAARVGAESYIENLSNVLDFLRG